MTERTPPTPIAPGTLLGGKYLVDRPIGLGGMGIVYRAEHTEIGRRVALKILNQDLTSNVELVTRFRREAKAAALIGHPGIVDVYDVGTTAEGAPYIVMEYMEGETLASRILSRGALPLTDVIPIVCDVLDVLEVAHKAGVIHRDLKPSNIFLCSDGRNKVIDFGISKFYEEGGEEQQSLTKTGISMGTPLYMAPEQMRDSRRAQPASDLYGVGAILYRALSGTPPFYSEVYTEVLVKTMTEAPRPLIAAAPTVPQALSDLVDRLLAKKPEDRPQQASTVKTMLLSAIGEDEQSIADWRPAPTRKRTGLKLAIGLAVVALIAAVVVFAPGSGKPDVDSRSKDSPRSTKYTLRLKASPLTAHWSFDGRGLECSECQVEGEPGSIHELIASAPGYQPHRESVKLDRSKEINVTLARISDEASPPPSPSPTTSTSPSPSAAPSPSRPPQAIKHPVPKPSKTEKEIRLDETNPFK